MDKNKVEIRGPAAPMPALSGAADFNIIVAVVTLLLAIMAVAVVLTIWGPDGGSASLVVTLIAAITPAMVALLSLLQAKRATDAVKEVHLDVNSRISQLLEETKQRASLEATLAAEIEARRAAVEVAGVERQKATDVASGVARDQASASARSTSGETSASAEIPVEVIMRPDTTKIGEAKKP